MKQSELQNVKNYGKKVNKIEKLKCSTACWLMCINCMSEGDTRYYNNNFSTVQTTIKHHVNNNNMLLSDENRMKCFH
jgi:hypothetical protein